MKKNKTKKAGRRGFLLPMRGVALSEHQDPRTKIYSDHQVTQRIGRAASLEAFHRQTVTTLMAIDAAKAKAVAERSRKQEIEEFSVDFVINPDGTEVSVEDHRIKRKILNETRREYFEDGRWKKLRAYEYHLVYKGQLVRIAQQKEKLRDSDPKGAKWEREELPPNEVPAIFYEAFTLNPTHAQGIVRACKAGQKEKTVTMLKQTGVELARFLEQEMKCEVNGIPFHVKDFAAHYQPNFVFIDSQGKKLGRRNQRHLGRALVGAYRLREFYISRGLSGAELATAMDETTGFKGASEGLDFRLAERGDVAIDLKVAKWMDQKIEELLKHPDFEELVPCFEEARSDYRATKDEDRRRLVEAVNREMSIEDMEERAEAASVLDEARQVKSLAESALAEAEQAIKATEANEQLVTIQSERLESEALVLREEARQLALDREAFLKDKLYALDEQAEMEESMRLLAEEKADLADALRLSQRLPELKKCVGEPFQEKCKFPGLLLGVDVSPDAAIFVLSPKAKRLLALLTEIDGERLGGPVGKILTANEQREEQAGSFTNAQNDAINLVSRPDLSSVQRAKLDRCKTWMNVEEAEAACSRISQGRPKSGDFAWVAQPTIRQLRVIGARFTGVFEGTFAWAWVNRLSLLREKLPKSTLLEIDQEKTLLTGFYSPPRPEPPAQDPVIVTKPI